MGSRLIALFMTNTVIVIEVVLSPRYRAIKIRAISAQQRKTERIDTEWTAPTGEKKKRERENPSVGNTTTKEFHFCRKCN